MYKTEFLICLGILLVVLHVLSKPAKKEKTVEGLLNTCFPPCPWFMYCKNGSCRFR